MNKKNIAKKYEEMGRDSLALAHDEKIRDIINRAQKYGITLFQDEVLASRLLDINRVQEISKKSMEDVAQIISSLIEAEEKAQLSHFTKE